GPPALVIRAGCPGTPGGVPAVAAWDAVAHTAHAGDAAAVRRALTARAARASGARVPRRYVDDLVGGDLVGGDRLLARELLDRPRARPDAAHDAGLRVDGERDAAIADRDRALVDALHPDRRLRDVGEAHVAAEGPVVELPAELLVRLAGPREAGRLGRRGTVAVRPRRLPDEAVEGGDLGVRSGSVALPEPDVDVARVVDLGDDVEIERV